LVNLRQEIAKPPRRRRPGYYLGAQRARLRAAKRGRNSLALRVARLTPCPFCASSSIAQRARLRAAKQGRNSLALWVARLTPCPFCARSSIVLVMVTEDQIDAIDPYVPKREIFPRLTPEMIVRTPAHGREEIAPEGAWLFERGDRCGRRLGFPVRLHVQQKRFCPAVGARGLFR
jgi:hypothetical protein